MLWSWGLIGSGLTFHNLNIVEKINFAPRLPRNSGQSGGSKGLLNWLVLNCFDTTLSVHRWWVTTLVVNSLLVVPTFDSFCLCILFFFSSPEFWLSWHVIFCRGCIIGIWMMQPQQWIMFSFIWMIMFFLSIIYLCFLGRLLMLWATHQWIMFH